jgi:hypothetical protein
LAQGIQISAAGGRVDSALQVLATLKGVKSE